MSGRTCCRCWRSSPPARFRPGRPARAPSNCGRWPVCDGCDVLRRHVCDDFPHATRQGRATRCPKRPRLSGSVVATYHTKSRSKDIILARDPSPCMCCRRALRRALHPGGSQPRFCCHLNECMCVRATDVSLRQAMSRRSPAYRPMGRALGPKRLHNGSDLDDTQTRAPSWLAHPSL